MKFLKLISPLLLLLAPLTGGWAKNIYISQNGTNTDGATATNIAVACSVAWLNTPGYLQATQWGANGVIPGDTVVLEGSITTPLTPNFSGTSGSNITILFDTNTVLSVPVLTNTTKTWIMLTGLSNVVVNGGYNGLITCTENGTSSAYTNAYNGQVGTNLYSTTGLSAINATSVKNLTVENLTISNLYNRLSSSDDPGGGNGGIELSGNNITIQSNCIYNSQDGIDFTYGYPATSNLTIVGNSILGFNHGIQLATGGTSYTTNYPWFYNVVIRSNIINELDTYEATNTSVGAAFHRDGIIIFDNAYNTNYGYLNPSNANPILYYIGGASNIDISCNWFNAGKTPMTVTAGSSAIYHNLSPIGSSNQTDRLLIYNNIFTVVPPLCGWNDGWICGGISHNSIIANNTLICWATNLSPGGFVTQLVTNTTKSPETYYGGGGIIAGGSFLVENNILYNMSSTIIYMSEPTTNCSIPFVAADIAYFTNIVSDYNDISIGNPSIAKDGPVFYCDVNECFGSAVYPNSECVNVLNSRTLAGWQALGFDLHSVSSAPSLDTGTWVPLASDTVAVGRGINLSAYFLNDYYGRSRSAAGAWDIGACAFAVPLAPPTNLHVVQ